MTTLLPQFKSADETSPFFNVRYDVQLRALSRYIETCDTEIDAAKDRPPPHLHPPACRHIRPPPAPASSAPPILPCAIFLRSLSARAQ